MGSEYKNIISLNVDKISLGRIGHDGGMQYPFTATFPPDFSPNKNMKENSSVANGSGIIFQEQTKSNNSDNIMVNIYYVETADNTLETSKEKLKYFSNTDKMLSNTKGADSMEVLVIGKETQTWKTDNDWLWQEMERFDADGNVTIRCKRME